MLLAFFVPDNRAIALTLKLAPESRYARTRCTDCPDSGVLRPARVSHRTPLLVGPGDHDDAAGRMRDLLHGGDLSALARISHRASHVDHMATAFMPNADLRRRLAEVELCPSVSNKVAAAEALIRCGMYYRAVGLYESAMRGIYAADPQLLMGLARAHVNNQTYEQAIEVLERLQRIDARFRPEELRLLIARALEGLGRNQDALREYETLVQVYVGLEAKCRYGLLLKKLGKDKQANQVFSEVLTYAQRFNLRLDAEQGWIDTARRSLPAEPA